MNKFYQVVQIPGKDLGCVALKDIKKGTLILQEKPQCFANASGPSEFDVKSLLFSFDQMSNSDKEEFLKLHNRFENLDELALNDKQRQLIESTAKSNNELEQIFKIYGIYRTNGFETGVGIQFARFNHSCCSNAEAMWNEEDETSEIRSVSKIKTGEEITLSYNWKQLSMKDLKTRQNSLLFNWGFKCCCDICKEEEVKPDDGKYQLFEKLLQEVKKCMQNQQHKNRNAHLENIKKEVICHKEMYKLAKDKRAPRTFIVNEILDDGFNASVQGYLSAESTYNSQFMEEFKKECDIFSTAGEQLSKVLPTKTYKEWEDRKHNFENWIKQVKEVLKEQQMQYSSLK